MGVNGAAAAVTAGEAAITTQACRVAIRTATVGPDYSGTGGGSTDGRAEMVGGYGGGLVRIIASDRVCVDGV